MKVQNSYTTSQWLLPWDIGQDRIKEEMKVPEASQQSAFFGNPSPQLAMPQTRSFIQWALRSQSPLFSPQGFSLVQQSHMLSQSENVDKDQSLVLKKMFWYERKNFVWVSSL